MPREEIFALDAQGIQNTGDKEAEPQSEPARKMPGGPQKKRRGRPSKVERSRKNAHEDLEPFRGHITQDEEVASATNPEKSGAQADPDQFPTGSASRTLEEGTGRSRGFTIVNLHEGEVFNEANLERVAGVSPQELGRAYHEVALRASSTPTPMGNSADRDQDFVLVQSDLLGPPGDVDREAEHGDTEEVQPKPKKKTKNLDRSVTPQAVPAKL